MTVEMPAARHIFPLTLLATLTVATNVALAKEQTSSASQQPSMNDMWDAMTSDSRIDLGLRNFYFNRDFRQHRTDSASNHKPSLSETWAQSARIDLRSGYFADIIGLDASWYGALKLVGDDEKYGSGVLRDRSATVKNGHLVARQESYNKLGQAYLKARFSSEDLNTHLKAGRLFIDTPLLNDSDSKATPSSTQGVLAELNYDNFGLYGIYSDRASGNTESGFKKYENSHGDSWDIHILGASANFDNGIGINFATGRAKEYLKQNYFNASYTANINDTSSLLLDGYYQTAKDDGRKYNDTLDSTLWNTAARLTRDTLSFTLSYQKVDGDTFDYSWGGSDSSGLATWNSVQYLDFNQKDEKSWQGRIDYSFANLGMPGLSVMTRYIKGDYKDGNNNKADEWERDTDIKYAFQQGSLAGLSITFRNATVRGSNKDNAIDENRLIIDYSIPLM